jgi:hypothetical protein
LLAFRGKRAASRGRLKSDGFLSNLADFFAKRYLLEEGKLDFAAIRLHYADCNLACGTLRAMAFTVGSDIYFADGAFAPHTRTGLWLLAHEVAHVVQQSAGVVTDSGSLPAMSVAPACTPEEHAADTAADAFLAGRSFRFAAAISRRAHVGRRVVQRYMAWEHALLGDLTADEVHVLTAQGPGHSYGGNSAQTIEEYCALLEMLGRHPRSVNEERLQSRYPGLATVRLPGSGLVVTLGELNILPDYLGHPEEIETAPVAFIQPLIQSVRSWSIAELRRSAGKPGRFRRLPGGLRYPLLGGLAESAEVLAVDALGKRCDFPPTKRYSSVLARNAAHFVPLSWYRWHSFHLMARALIEQSKAADADVREKLRITAQVTAGYADHFLQDSFAAGHLINKTLIMQWYIEWLGEFGVSYPDRDLLAAMIVARQPLLHGPHLYDRLHARLGARPRPSCDPQDMADAATVKDSIESSGLISGPGREERAVYAAYLTMLGSATVQLGAKVIHDYLNKRSLVVSSGPDGPPFRLYGDHTLLAGGSGSWRAAQAAAASRRAISELLQYGETDVSSWEIFESFPDHVEEGGRLISLEEWHRNELRDLCFRDLFGRWSTRATRLLLSGAFRRLGTPMALTGSALRSPSQAARSWRRTSRGC